MRGIFHAPTDTTQKANQLESKRSGRFTPQDARGTSIATESRISRYEGLRLLRHQVIPQGADE
jgi:hypothetical protein